jgi:tetratricopeptide (TPR) repeat protein
MDKEDTRRDPRPYMYASMAYFEISKNDEMAEDYPRAFRDAIKYGGKARRYDKDNEYMPDFDRYLSELKAEVMQEAKFHYETENYRKSTTFAKNVQRLDPNDVSAILLKGTAEWKSKNVYQAETTIEEAKEALKVFTPSSVSSEGKPAYRYAVIEFAKLMKEEGRKSDATPFLDAMEPLLGEDKEFANFVASY